MLALKNRSWKLELGCLLEAPQQEGLLLAQRDAPGPSLGHYTRIFEISYPAHAEDNDSDPLCKARLLFSVWLSVEEVPGCGKECGGNCSRLHGLGSKLHSRRTLQLLKNEAVRQRGFKL